MEFLNKSMSPVANGVRPAWASPKHPDRRTPYQEGLTTCNGHLSGVPGIQHASLLCRWFSYHSTLLSILAGRIVACQRPEKFGIQTDGLCCSWTSVELTFTDAPETKHDRERERG